MLDLTHPVDDKTVSWPSASQFQVTSAVAMLTGGGYWYESRDISQSEHSGTHMDAPAHFYQDRWHTADIPLERLVAVPGVKVDIETRADTDPDTMLTVTDLENWERHHGEIPDHAVDYTCR